jgi:FkbM family methyltransferase
VARQTGRRFRTWLTNPVAFASAVGARTGFSSARLLRQYLAVTAAARKEARQQATGRSLKTFEFLDFEIACWRAHELRSLLDEIFHRQDYFCPHLDGAPRILDCGSNIGLSVLYFKLLWPDSRVVAFEPDPSCFEALSRNVQNNRLLGVELHNAAVGNEDGRVEFFSDPTRQGGVRGSIHRERARNGAGLMARAMKLSGFLRDEPATLLKMDVEGAELDVMNDLSSSNSWGKIDNVIVEYHHNLMPRVNRLSTCVQTLETAGFEFRLNAISGPTGRWDGSQDILIRGRRTSG